MRWKNLKDLTKSTIRLEDKAQQGASNMVDEAVFVLIKDIQSSWSASSPSSPGQAPAVVTGTLNDSVQAEAPGRGADGRFNSGNSVIRAVKVKAFYAPYLEQGTSKMAARPFMLPAVKRLESIYPMLARKNIKL